MPRAAARRHSRSAKSRWAASAAANAATKPSSRERIEPRLPPQARDSERAGPPLDARLDPADEAVAVQDRQDVVAPAPLRGGDVDLPDVVEAVEAAQEVAVPAQRVERRQERDARRRRRRAVGPAAISASAWSRNARSSATTKRSPLQALHLDREQPAGLDERRPVRRLDRPRSPCRRPTAPGCPTRPAGHALGSARAGGAAAAPPRGGAPRGSPPGRAARRGRRRAGCPRAARIPRMPASARPSRIGPDLVRRAPVPVDRLARADVARQQRRRRPGSGRGAPRRAARARRRCRPRGACCIRSQIQRYSGSSATGTMLRLLL